MLRSNSPLNLLFTGSFKKDLSDLHFLEPFNANIYKPVQRMASFDHSSPCYPGEEIPYIYRFKEHRPTEARHSAS